MFFLLNPKRSVFVKVERVISDYTINFMIGRQSFDEQLIYIGF
jgi:hypothetical protein